MYELVTQKLEILPFLRAGVAPVSSLDEGDYLLYLSHVHIRVVMMNGDEASELSGVTAHARAR